MLLVELARGRRDPHDSLQEKGKAQLKYSKLSLIITGVGNCGEKIECHSLLRGAAVKGGVTEAGLGGELRL